MPHNAQAKWPWADWRGANNGLGWTDRGFCSEWRTERLCAGLRNTLLHPSVYFAFKPARAASELDGLRKSTVLNELVEPLIGHAGKRGDKCHVDKRIFG